MSRVTFLSIRFSQLLQRRFDQKSWQDDPMLDARRAHTDFWSSSMMSVISLTSNIIHHSSHVFCVSRKEM